MKNQQISVTVPAVPSLLHAAARFLDECSRELESTPADVTSSDDVVVATEPVETPYQQAAEQPESTSSEPPPAQSTLVDANGLPWDERIHAGSKTMNKDGTWKKRRGVNDATFNAVVAELKGATPEPAHPHDHLVQGGDNDPEPAPDAGMVFGVQDSQAAAPVNVQPQGTVQPVVQTTPVVQQPAGGVVADVSVQQPQMPTVNFAQVLQLWTKNSTQGIINDAELAAIINPLNLPNLGALSQNQHLIPQVYDALNNLIASKGGANG